MMNRLVFLFVALGLLAVTGCQDDANLPPEERYAKELAAAQTVEEATNDFYLGLEIGIARKEYYNRCTVLNQKQQITMGAGGNAVNHPIDAGLERPATMTFAPEFSEDRTTILAYTVLLSYDDWSPWNKKSHGSQLIKDVFPHLKATYGDGFYAIPHPKVGSALVQFKGNRRISAWVKDERYVQMRFVNVNALPEEEVVYRTDSY